MSSFLQLVNSSSTTSLTTTRYPSAHSSTTSFNLDTTATTVVEPNLPLQPKGQQAKEKIWKRVVKNKFDRALISLKGVVKRGTSAEASLIEKHVQSKANLVIERHIGNGSNGQVLQAQLLNHPSERVAVKRFKLLDETSISKIQREIYYSLTLSHENLMTAKFVIKQERDYQLIMPLYPTDLFMHITNDPKMGGDGRIRRKWMSEIVSAVAHLHRLGLSHQDLKLENICITHDGHVKLVDYGSMFRFKDPKTHARIPASGIHGSDPYLAPEVFEAFYSNAPYLPDMADAWSVGIIWLCLIRRAFLWDKAVSSDDGFNKFRKKRDRIWLGITSLIAATDEESPDMVSKAEQSYLMQLLTIDPEKRLDLLKLCELLKL